MQKYDSVIFDLDGTIWDTVNSVCGIWNDALVEVGLQPIIDNNKLSKCMGLLFDQIIDKLIPQATEEQADSIKTKFLTTEQSYLAEHGGILYDRVEETLKVLQKTYQLFIVSNCQDGYIEAFFKAHGLR